MNFIQIFQTQSFRNFVENIIEAEYNMKIYHADMNLTFQYIYTKVIHSSQEIDTCLTFFKLSKYIFSYSIKQNRERPRNTPLTFHYITLKKYLLMLENVNFNEEKKSAQWCRFHYHCLHSWNWHRNLVHVYIQCRYFFTKSPLGEEG